MFFNRGPEKQGGFNARGLFPEVSRRVDVTRTSKMRGFSLLEIVVVLGIVMVVSAIAVPSLLGMLRSYRAAGDAKGLASQFALAKMRASSEFTQAQVSCNLAGNSCQLQLCATKGAATCTTWAAAEGGTQILSQNDSFGFGVITLPAGTQTTIQNTAQVVFNSRGIPVDGTGTPTGNDAVYVTDQSGHTYAVTASASGQVKVWLYSGGTWKAL